MKVLIIDSNYFENGILLKEGSDGRKEIRQKVKDVLKPAKVKVVKYTFAEEK